MNKYILELSPEVVKNPIFSETVLETQARIKIMRAKVDYDKGMFVVSILEDPKKQEEVVEAFKRRGVEVRRLRRTVINDEERCVSCGACISVCPTEAISFNSERMIEIDKEKCHRCGICIEVCPRSCLSIQDHYR